MSVVAIIQARTGSTRLPGKVLLPLGVGTVLSTVCDRVGAAKSVDRVVVATTLKREDAAITKHCHSLGVEYALGSEADVLDRVYQVAVSRKADYVVDITADCPLVDPRHIDRCMAELTGKAATGQSSRSRQAYAGAPDYVSNCFSRDWPDGLDVQCYTVAALEKVWRDRESVREHVGWNIGNLSPKYEFLLKQPLAPAKYRHPEWGLTLDERADYDLLKRIFMEAALAHRGSNLFAVEWALDFLLARPELLAVNAGVKRKEPGKP